VITLSARSQNQAPACLIALRDIGEMHLHKGHLHCEQCISDRQAAVGIRRGVQDQAIGRAGQPLDLVDQGAFVIGLPKRSTAPGESPRRGASFDVREVVVP
jgi:hypothetical protein